jgi:hypothetical protein
LNRAARRYGSVERNIAVKKTVDVPSGLIFSIRFPVILSVNKFDD